MSASTSQAPPSQQQLQLAPAPPHYRHPHHRATAGHQQAHFPEDFGVAAAEFPAYEELAGFPCVSSSGGGGTSSAASAAGAAGGSTPHPMRLEDAAGDRDSPGSPSSAELQRPACEFAARAGPLPPQTLPYPTCLAGNTTREAYSVPVQYRKLTSTRSGDKWRATDSMNVCEDWNIHYS
ncbi:hypothetical protein MTO96_000389 [Rhipicephalus appendiculatus]